MNKRASSVMLAALLIAAPACHRSAKMLSASGTVEITQVDIASRIASRIEALAVDEGAAVRKGDILARLDSRIVAAQKETAEAAFAQARQNFERSKNLIASRSITREQYDAASAQYAKAVADLAQAQVLFDEAILHAPWDGVILKKNAEVGELVAANTPVFTLGDTTRAKVTIYVPLPDLGKIRLNQEARVSVDAFPGKYFTGRVSRISGQAEFTPKNIQTKDERVKEVFAVEVSVPNPAYDLKPGMPADVDVAL